MNNKVVLLPIVRLKCHEAVDPKHVQEVQAAIVKEGKVIHPVVVAKQGLIILDGHHRVAALKKLGKTKVPAILVDYFSPDVKVYLRRKELQILMIKLAVVAMATSGNVFPKKTTRHVISHYKHC